MPATAACADSEPMPDGALEPARPWSDLHFRAAISHPPKRRWRPAAALLVLLLHVVLLAGLLLDRVRIPAAQALRIEVSFIERVAAPEPPKAAASPPRRARPPEAAPVNDTTPMPATQAVDALHQQPAPLRLQLPSDEWLPPDTPQEGNPLKRNIDVQLPGRAEPFVEGVRFSPPMSPEKWLKAIGKGLFGAIDPDPCPDARRRLANLESNRDRYAIEADLRTLERHCKP